MRPGRGLIYCEPHGDILEASHRREGKREQVGRGAGRGKIGRPAPSVRTLVRWTRAARFSVSSVPLIRPASHADVVFLASFQDEGIRDNFGSLGADPKSSDGVHRAVFWCGRRSALHVCFLFPLASIFYVPGLPGLPGSQAWTGRMMPRDEMG